MANRRASVVLWCDLQVGEVGAPNLAIQDSDEFVLRHGQQYVRIRSA